MEDTVKHVPSQGVRKLRIEDQLPDCRILINEKLYRLEEICRGKKVADIGCGYGANRPLVEAAGGTWVGVEPFEGGAHTVVGDAEELPFEDGSFDVVIMDAVLEHIPDVSKAFTEVARVLRKDGVFVGYVAFMECFHEISYSHLSFKALEHFSKKNGMKLEAISGGSRFGIDYHSAVLYYPFVMNWMRALMAFCIRLVIRCKSIALRYFLQLRRKESPARAKERAGLYYKLECLRMSNGFSFIIRKL